MATPPSPTSAASPLPASLSSPTPVAPASAIDRAVIAHVAQLASLSLSAREAETLTVEIARILAYVDELASLDTSDVPPTAQVVASPAGSALRADDVVPCLSHADALAQAPRVSQGGFAVPGFVDGAGS